MKVRMDTYMYTWGQTREQGKEHGPCFTVSGIQSCGSWNNTKPPICFVWQISKANLRANVESQKNSHQYVHMLGTGSVQRSGRAEPRSPLEVTLKRLSSIVV